MNHKSKTFFSRIKKEPLFKFLLISIAIYVAYGFYGVTDDDTLAKENTVTITKEEIGMMTFGFQQRLNRVPTNEERQILIDKRIREEALYAEAKKMGIDKGDVVIIRRVVLQYRNLVEGLLVPPDPDDEILDAYFQEHIDEYIPDELISFTQLFFDPDKREETTIDDANKVLLELQNKETFPTDLSKYGDNFMLPKQYSRISPLQIRKYFGSGFEESITQLDTNIWIGPVLSGYGTHLVYISEKQVAEAPPLEEIRERVLTDYLVDKKGELIQLYMDNLLDKYEVVVVDEKTEKE
jgi:hypothetical protein